MQTTFSKEQIERFKHAGFSKEEIALFVFDPKYAPNEEQLVAIEETHAIAEALGYLPENPEELLNEIENKFGDIANADPQTIKNRIVEVAKENSQLIKQTAVLYSIIDLDTPSNND